MTITDEERQRLLLRFHISRDASDALLYAAMLIEHGDLDELAVPQEEAVAWQGDEEARVRTLAAHALRQLAAGGLPKRVFSLAPEPAPAHLAPPLFREGETVSSDTHLAFQCGEVVARTYDLRRGWIYDVYWHDVEARDEASRRGAPWMSGADLKAGRRYG